MLTREENELLTRVGPGTPGGDWMRRYWQPVALSEELPQGGPPIPVRLLGEDLVLFRDDADRIGLLYIHCAHRAADLSYGRVEDGGLRCIYHGWLYDVEGNCLEQPAEPVESTFKSKIKQRAYPCREEGGIVFAYMGPGEPPVLPLYGPLRVPEDQRWVTKYYHECNYLQGLEGNMDPTHVPYLHRFLKTEGGRKIYKEHPKESTAHEEENLRNPVPGLFRGPEEVEETDFGIWSKGEPELVLPSFCLTGGGPQRRGDGYQLYWRVAIDDEHHWLYVLAFKRSGPLDKQFVEQRTEGLITSDYHFIRNKANRYLQDREEQRTSTFTGMGAVFVVQDACVNEGAGPIQDHTEEHLGAADISLVAGRRLMLKGIRQVQDGIDPPGVIRDARLNEADPLFLKTNRYQVGAQATIEQIMDQRMARSRGTT